MYNTIPLRYESQETMVLHGINIYTTAPHILPTEAFTKFIICVFTGNIKMETGKRKLSLFAQSMRAKRNISEAEINNSCSINTKVNEQTFGQTSVLVNGQDKDVIHQENVEKLSKMSPEEILNEQQKLLADIDPGLIEFIKSRKKNRSQPSVSESPLEETTATQTTEVKMECIPPIVSGE